MRTGTRKAFYLLFGALLCLNPAATIAAAISEEARWEGRAHEDGATLSYGIPQSDYGPVSFSCTRNSGEVTFVLAHEPVNAREGVEVEVRLQAGDIELPIRTVGARLELDDTFILEGKTRLDERLIDILTSRGTLFVFVEDGAEEFPLDGAREAAVPLIERCGG